jgi:hypothetical protein
MSEEKKKNGNNTGFAMSEERKDISVFNIFFDK